jgi:predicted membrane-bound dolichyl-phosphate-mannose-protein mannosyltransferase
MMTTSLISVVQLIIGVAFVWLLPAVVAGLLMLVVVLRRAVRRGKRNAGPTTTGYVRPDAADPRPSLSEADA